MLAAYLEREPIDNRTAALDLCTGSGVLAVAAALRGASRVTAVDVSRRAVLSARINARLNGVRVRALRGDLFAPVGAQRFDLIVSNPPYLPGTEPQLPRRGLARAWEGGPSGRAFIDRICASAPSHLNAGGVLLLVHSSVCGERETVDGLSERGLDATVVARHRGPLGSRLREREAWLRAQRLLAGEHEELLIIRAQAGEHSAPVVGLRRRAPYQCTPRIRWASATCSVEACSSTPVSPRAAAESGNTL